MKLVFEHNIQEIPCDIVKLFETRPRCGILKFSRINFRKFMNIQQEPNKFMLINDNKEVQYCSVDRIDKYNKNVIFDVSPLRDMSIPEYAIPICDYMIYVRGGRYVHPL